MRTLREGHAIYAQRQGKKSEERTSGIVLNQEWGREFGARQNDFINKREESEATFERGEDAGLPNPGLKQTIETVDDQCRSTTPSP